MGSVSCTSMDDVINFAIDREEKAKEFYQQCAGRAKNPGIKTFFQEMADEEQRHKDLLVGLNPFKLDEVKLDQVEDLKISDFLVDVKFSDDITYQEALTMAMKKEEKAHAFYAAWKTKCMHEKTAKVFELLATEEMKHKRKIENIYDDEILTWD
ncbi:MAG: ferritin family protein [Syntrophobacteraceae bacterium]|nr:ferritin family protein [Syntrophobacteraceae bacterium]